MFFINPLGRQDTNKKFTACLCDNRSSFSRARGKDGCFHCGCGCDNKFYSSGNSRNAFLTINKS